MNPRIVDTVNRGNIHIEEPGLQTVVRAAIGSGNLRASLEPEKADVFFLALPTPITKDKKADMRYVTEATEKILPCLQPDCLVILESTSPPGTCRDLLVPTLKRSAWPSKATWTTSAKAPPSPWSKSSSRSAFTYRNCPIFGRWEVYPEMELAQCIGPHEWTYALYPHTGDWRNGVFEQAEALNLPLEAAQADPHKGKLPKAMSFLEITGGNVQVAAFKRAEDRKSSYIVRLFNPDGKTVTATLKLWKPIKKAWLTNLNEERREKLEPKAGTLKLAVAAKKIVSLEFQV